MTLKEFLIEKKIPFVIVPINEGYGEEEGIMVDDNLLIPYEEELRKNFPEWEFEWDVQRYRNEPNRRSG